MAECPVCLEDVDVFETLSCGHNFCTECIQRWKDTCERRILPVKCPLCNTLLSHPSVNHVLRTMKKWIEDFIATSRKEGCCIVVVKAWEMTFMCRSPLSINLFPSILRDKFFLELIQTDKHTWMVRTSAVFLRTVDLALLTKTIAEWT